MRRLPAKGGNRFKLFLSPIGWVGIVAGPAGLVEVLIRSDATDLQQQIICNYPEAEIVSDGICAAAVRQLHDYFGGCRHEFDLAVDLSGLPPFTRTVLETLQKVPSGRTVSYGELAVASGRPGAARAVGRAMAGNPLPIIIPCHRVIGADGALTGYSGGEGLPTKKWLLQFEKNPSGLTAGQPDEERE